MFKPNKTPINIIPIGDSNAGKTCLIDRLFHDQFKENNSPTVGAYFQNFNQFHVWDTAGTERFHSLFPGYVRRGDIILFVYDATSQSSYENLFSYWIPFVDNHAQKNPYRILVRTKIDKLEKVKKNGEILYFKWDDGYSKAKIHDYAFASISSKTKDGISELLAYLNGLGTQWNHTTDVLTLFPEFSINNEDDEDDEDNKQNEIYYNEKKCC